MEEPQSSSDQVEKSAESFHNVQLSQEMIEAEYTTPLKSKNSSQGVPYFPLKYETKPPTPEPSNQDDEAESNKNELSNSSSSLNNGSTLHDVIESTQSTLDSTGTIEQLIEPVTESNVEYLYNELCELEHLFLKDLSLEWFYFIFKGEDVNEIKSKLTDINSKLDSETNDVCPNKSDIWTWAKEVGSPDNVKLVIMGQDPYSIFTRDKKIFQKTFVPMSDGLGFSINPRYFEVEKKLPASNSLRKILKLTSPANAASESFHGDLRLWVKQGVLLFDVHLTTAAHRKVDRREGGFHSDFGWEFVTDLVLQKLGTVDRRPTVFLLWGKSARSKAYLVTGVHKVIDACHPMWPERWMSEFHDIPINCYCNKYCWMPHHESEAEPRNDFKSANEFLEHQGRTGIVWDCFGNKEMLRRKSTNFRDNLEKCNKGYQREVQINNEKQKGCKRGLEKTNEDDENCSKESKKAK